MIYSKNNHFSTLPEEDLSRSILDGVLRFNGMKTKDIEATLVSELMEDFDPVGEVPYTNRLGPNGKWRVTSSLQKAIRRKDFENAYKAATALYNGGFGDYAWRRLAVICLEDLGIAALPLAALVFAIQGRKKWRADNGDLHLLLYIVGQMVNVVCDRTLCETAVSAWYNPDYEAIKHHYIEGYDPQQAASIYRDKTASPDLRQLAGLALSGAIHNGGDYRDRVTSEKNLDALTEALDELQPPTLIRYIITRGVALGTEGLHIALPINWDRFRGSEFVCVAHDKLPESPIIKGLPSVAYDMHTYEGKRAYNYFKKACAPVAELLAKYSPPDPVDAVSALVFLFEAGCVMAEHLSYPYQQEALLSSWKAELASVGLPNDDEHIEEYREVITSNFAALDKARRVCV